MLPLRYPCLIAALLVCPLHSAVKPNALFSDNAVLQQDTPIPVWGTAADNEKVTVQLDGQQISTTAKDGKWMVQLPSHKAGGPFAMTITGQNTNLFTNILVGEVWVCSGQSNMEFRLNGASNAVTEIQTANYPQLRMFTVNHKIALNPCDEVVGKWMVCTPATAAGFSAVGYYFGRDLLKAKSVPVGMIHSAWGGTPAQAWTSFSGFSRSPELKFYTDALTNSVADYCKALEAYRTVLDDYHAKVTSVPTSPPWPTNLPSSGPVSPFDGKGSMPQTPTVLYNGMIAPLLPYAIRGVIWYQGESNAGQAKLYQTLFPAMIADWRQKWGRGDFPFLFTQIAPFGGQPPEIREAQLLTLGKTTNTAMAVTTDVGDANNIHPTRKEPVGQRLALAARAVAYGEKIEYSGPLYESMRVDSNKIVLTFSHTGNALLSKDGELKGFTIAGADGKALPAKAEIVGSTVVVSSDSVPLPVAVRYGWTNVPDVNLFNHEGLPASPFRTDYQ
jgi:sialate O-acetylesterase